MLGPQDPELENHQQYQASHPHRISPTDWQESSQYVQLPKRHRTPTAHSASLRPRSSTDPKHHLEAREAFQRSPTASPLIHVEPHPAWFLTKDLQSQSVRLMVFGFHDSYWPGIQTCFDWPPQPAAFLVPVSEIGCWHLRFRLTTAVFQTLFSFHPSQWRPNPQALRFALQSNPSPEFHDQGCKMIPMHAPLNQ